MRITPRLASRPELAPGPLKVSKGYVWAPNALRQRAEQLALERRYTMRVTDKRYGEGRGPGALSVEPEMADFPTWDHVIGLLLENPRRIVEIDATDFVAFNGDGDSQTPGLSTVANRIKLEGFRRGLVTPANVVGEGDQKVVQATYRPLGESDNVPKWVLALQRAGHTQDLRDDFAQFLSENDDS